MTFPTVSAFDCQWVVLSFCSSPVLTIDLYLPRLHHRDAGETSETSRLSGRPGVQYANDPFHLTVGKFSIDGSADMFPPRRFAPRASSD